MPSAKRAFSDSVCRILPDSSRQNIPAAKTTTAANSLSQYAKRRSLSSILALLLVAAGSRDSRRALEWSITETDRSIVGSLTLAWLPIDLADLEMVVVLIF